MTKKLEGNGLFDRSRMIIPQQCEGILNRQHISNRREKPGIDKNQWEDIAFALNDSLQ